MEEETKKNVSITVTVNLGKYQNVKVMLSKTVEKEEEDYEKISEEITTNLQGLLPGIIKKVKRVLEEYEEDY